MPQLVGPERSRPSPRRRRSPASALLRTATTLRRVLEREPAGDVRRRDLSLRVTDTSRIWSTPQSATSSPATTITANNTGCTTSTRSMSGAPGAPSIHPGASSPQRARALAHSVDPLARIRRLLSNSCTAMPGHCAP